MKKHIHILKLFIQDNLAKEMEYRINFLFWILVEGIYVLLHIYIIDIMYKFTNSIFGWNKAEMLFLVGIFRVIEGVFHIIFHPNILKIPQRVNKGELDMYLTKPINPLFMISTRYHSWDETSTVITGAVLVIYSLSILGLLNIYSILLSIVVCILGEVALFSLMLALASWSFFIERMTAIKSIWEVTSRAIRNPIEIYSRNRLILDILFIPFSLVATWPAQIVLGKISIWMLPLEMAFVVLLGYSAYRFWLYALGHYSSASS